MNLLKRFSRSFSTARPTYGDFKMTREQGPLSFGDADYPKEVYREKYYEAILDEKIDTSYLNTCRNDVIEVATENTVWNAFQEFRLLPELIYIGILQGVITTVEPEWTINYPFEKTPISPLYRGEHALR